MNSQATLSLDDLKRMFNDVNGGTTIDLGGAVVKSGVDGPVALARPDVTLENGTIHLAPGQWLRVDASGVTFKGLTIRSSSTGSITEDDNRKSKPGMVTVYASFTMHDCRLICRGNDGLSAALKITKPTATNEEEVVVNLHNCNMTSDVNGYLVVGHVYLDAKSCNMSG